MCESVWGLCALGIRGSGVVGWTELPFGGMFGDCKQVTEIILEIGIIIIGPMGIMRMS